MKYYLKYFCADSYEDDWAEGESFGCSSSWDDRDLRLDRSIRFDTLNEVLEYVMEENCFDSKNNQYWYRDDVNCSGEFWNNVMVDENNYEASPEDIEEWKEGKRKLWACHMRAVIGKCEEVELGEDEDYITG